MKRTAAGRTLVVGLGNPLMADDGIGLAALERLRERGGSPEGVELIDGGTWGLFLLPEIEDAARAILLDAVDVGAPPGSLVVLERDEIPRAWRSKALSPHQIGVQDLIALATLRGTLPEETVVMGIQPGAVELATRLSPAAERALDALVDRVAERLAAWGQAPAPVMEAPCTR